MHASDALTTTWIDRQAKACGEGNCKYADRAKDDPHAKDSASCHGWHGGYVETMREGVKTSACVRHHRCPRFLAWIAAAPERRARREGAQQAQRPRAAVPREWA